MTELLLRYFGELPPRELKLALFIWMALERNGGKPVDLTIEDIAAGTGISSRRVQEKRGALRRKSVIQILSGPRERSRYAFPMLMVTEQPSPEPPAATVPPPPSMTEQEEIVMFMSEMTICGADAEFLLEAERTAGGRQRLLHCLRTMRLNPYRPRLSGPSALSLIAGFSYQMLRPK